MVSSIVHDSVINNRELVSPFSFTEVELREDLLILSYTSRLDYTNPGQLSEESSYPRMGNNIVELCRCRSTLNRRDDLYKSSVKVNLNRGFQSPAQHPFVYWPTTQRWGIKEATTLIFGYYSTTAARVILTQ